MLMINYHEFLKSLNRTLEHYEKAIVFFFFNLL